MNVNGSDTFRYILRRELQEIGKSAVINVAGFILPLFALSLVGAGIRNGAEWLAVHEWPVLSLVFVLLSGLAWLAVMTRVTPEWLRNPDGRIVAGAVVGFSAAAAMVWIFVFAALSFQLMELDLVPYALAAEVAKEPSLGDLSDAYLWYFFDLIPVLHINDAFGWSADVDMNGGRKGAILLAFRIIIVFQVFALGKRLLDESRSLTRAR